MFCRRAKKFACPAARTYNANDKERKMMMRPMKLAGSQLLFGDGCLAFLKDVAPSAR